jgi:hypothetical protein
VVVVVAKGNREKRRLGHLGLCLERPRDREEAVVLDQNTTTMRAMTKMYRRLRPMKVMMMIMIMRMKMRMMEMMTTTRMMTTTSKDMDLLYRDASPPLQWLTHSMPPALRLTLTDG